jgi:hypothetical protein
MELRMTTVSEPTAARPTSSPFFEEKVLSVHHWTDTLFSFTTTRDAGFRFRSGQAATSLGSTLSLPLVRPGAVDTWTYDVFAHELLRTPRLGELDTVRVTPRPFTNARGTLASEIWFAPRLQYLPVRIKVNFGEEAALDLMVESLEQR